MQSPFEGRLVRLRAREPGDEPPFHTWINDPEVTEHLMLRYPLSHAAERKWVESTDEPAYGAAHFSVETIAESKLIGSVALRGASPEDRCATLGISIGDKAYWDRGYGSDAMRTLCRFGFEMMNLHRIELDVYADNLRARHVYENVGFREEGCRREANFKYGHYVDVIGMGLLRGELRME